MLSAVLARMMSASSGARSTLHSTPRATNPAAPSPPEERASKHSGADEKAVSCNAELSAAAHAAKAIPADRAMQPPMYFADEFILERARETDAKLKLSGTAV